MIKKFAVISRKIKKIIKKYPSPGAEGAAVVYALRNTDALSQKILNNLAQEGQIALKNYQRRLPSDPSKDYYAIIRDTPNTESVIIEYGYVDNTNDATKLKNNYKNYAEAVIRAVMEHKYLTYKPPKDSKDYYTVKSGDTLWTIARAFNTTVDKLKDINNLKSNNLTIGQVLKVTESKETPSEPGSNENIYTVQNGDSLWKIAQKYSTTVGTLQELNNLSTTNLSIGQKLKIPTSESTSNTGETTYTVKSGDSLWKIASKYDTTVDKIKTANNLSSNNLFIGQKLIIPTETKYKVYTVQNGDSLYLIAKNNNTTVDKLKNLNSLSSNTLMIGQKLLIPSA